MRKIIQSITVAASMVILVACGGGGGGDTTGSGGTTGSGTTGGGSISNSSPVANAGTDQIVLTGSTVALTGLTSTDADGDVLTHQWSIQQKPNGSSATLDSANTALAAITTDISGVYILKLEVSDSKGGRSQDTVQVTSNIKPIAVAGSTQMVKPSTITLSGIGSNDSDIDSLNYSWTVKSKPANANVWIGSNTNVSPGVNLTTPGLYVFELIVSDGKHFSEPSTVNVSVGTWATPIQATSTNETNWGGTWYTGSASYAIDGNNITGWTYNGMGSIEFDLGVNKTIGGVNVQWQGSVSNGNTVNIYIDGVRVVTEQKISSPGAEIIFNSPLQGRRIVYETVAIPHNVYLQTATWSEIGEFTALVFD